MRHCRNCKNIKCFYWTAGAIGHWGGGILYSRDTLYVQQQNSEQTHVLTHYTHIYRARDTYAHLNMNEQQNIVEMYMHIMQYTMHLWALFSRLILRLHKKRKKRYLSGISLCVNDKEQSMTFRKKSCVKVCAKSDKKGISRCFSC